MRSLDAINPAARHSRAAPDAHGALQALFNEVSALASQLRKTDGIGHRQDDFPPAGWKVVQVLEAAGPLTVPAIARNKALSRQSIQPLVNRLESQGLVAFASNPAHKRSALVHLTENGRRLATAVKEHEARSLQALLPYMSPASLAQAARVLRRLRALLAGKEPPPPQIAAESRTPSHVRAPRRPARRRQAVPPTPPPASKPEAAEPAHDEFPINLL